MDKRKRASPSRQTKKVFKEYVIVICEALAATVFISYICYRSIYGMLLFPIILWLNRKRFFDKKEKKEAIQFNKEFKEFLTGVNTSLQAGYSVENAIAEAGNNLLMLYGEDSVFLPGVNRVNAQIKMRIPVEKAFYELQEYYSSEELIEFANLFLFAKRLGGDYAKNIRSCASKIEDKIDVLQEIDTMLAEKQLELRIMLATPAAILLYVGIASEGFINNLYHNLSGVLVMSGCLVAYFAIALLGKRIVDIKV